MIRELALPEAEGSDVLSTSRKHQNNALCLCPHAVAFGSTVYGLSAENASTRFEHDDNDDKSHQEDWLSSSPWKTCLGDDDDESSTDDHQNNNVVIISQVVSNQDGSIIAVSSSQQKTVVEKDGSVLLLFVTLLRGADGQVLVTRKVGVISSDASSSSDDIVAATARLSFVSDAHRPVGRSPTATVPTVVDTLLIQVPGMKEDEGDCCQLVLVSGIHGKALNGENAESLQEATRSMKVRALKLPMESDDGDTASSQLSSIRDITGFFLSPPSTNVTLLSDDDDDSSSSTDPQQQNNSPRMIRFVACDHDGNLSVYDYNPSEKTACKLVQSDIVLELHGQSWKVDGRVGLHPQQKYSLGGGGGETYLVCAAVSGNRLAVAWFDPMSLKSVCHFPIEVNRSTDKSSRSQQRLKVLSLQPITSCSKDSALAVAVAIKGGGAGGGRLESDTTIHVLQAAVEDTMGLTILCRPHSVFQVPGRKSDDAQTTLSASLSPYNAGGDCTIAGPYSFLFQQRYASGGTTCMAFCPPVKTSQSVGRAQIFIEEGNFELADKILKEAGIDSDDSVPYATIHPSDVALKQLLRVVSNGQGNVQAQVQEYLDRLVQGAKSGHCEEYVPILAKAVDAIISSLGESVAADVNITILSTLKSAVDHALTAMLPTSSKMIASLEDKKLVIEKRLKVLEFLASSDGKRVSMVTSSSKIQSPAHLLSSLIKEHKFSEAGDVWRSVLQSLIPPEVMVSSMLQITASVPPAEYLGLLHDAVLPSLTINHDLLPPLRAWCCRIADALDEKNDDTRNLDAAIGLLETVHVQTKELQLQVHESFSTFSPFVENDDLLRKAKRSSPRNCSVDSESSRADINLDSSRRHRENVSSGGTRPVPSMLQMVGLRAKASKSTTRVPLATDSDQSYEETEECVEEKLSEALCLKQARQYGMAREVATLRMFSKKGGAHFCAIELVRFLSTLAETDHHTRMRSLSEKVEPFCEAFGVKYDEALHEYACDICKSMSGTERAIHEAASIARCCPSVIVKCRTTLLVLRAALLHGYSPPWLMTMAGEAIAWAATCDTGLQSELEEAARLLLIDGIISKYCGHGARQLFRVDNPRHAVRLVQFVSHQIDNPTVLDDVISLCGAFTHLSPSEACGSVFQRAILSGDPSMCVALFRDLYDRDPSLARKTLVSAISFIAELLQEDSVCTSRTRFHHERAMSTCAAACELLSAAKEHDRNLDPEAATSIDCYLSDLSLDGLHQKLLRLRELQSNHGIFLALSDFSSPNKLLEAANQVFQPVLASHAASDAVNFYTEVEKAKRACSLMVGGQTLEFKNLWSVAAATATQSVVEQRLDHNLIEFLHALDMLNGTENALTSRARLSLALALCNEASEDADSMKSDEGITRISVAASLLRNYGVMLSTNSLLPATVALDALLDTACHILVRADEGHGDMLSKNREKMQADAWKRTVSLQAPARPSVELHVSQPALHPSWYIGDGLLLPPAQALSLTSWFCREMIRDRGTLEGGTNELYRLVTDRGAYTLALQVLSTSTAGYLSVANTHDLSKGLNVTASKEFAIELVNTGKSLAERSLGGSVAGMTSGVIDSELSVTFLLALPLKVAFKLYKSAIPTAIKTRAFERLFTLANIGKVCSGCQTEGVNFATPSLWKKQHLFIDQCERLAKRAVWMRVLKNHSVEFDMNRFREIEATRDVSVGPNNSTVSYQETLLYPLIASLMGTLGNSEVIHLATLFANAYGLTGGIVLEKHIEYLLSPPGEEIHDKDVRIDLVQCRRIAKESLRALPPYKRCVVLRQCLLTLSKDEKSSTDYERFSLVLSLYYDALIFIVENVDPLGPADRERLESEIELVGRRKDALLILSSYFQGTRAPDRPNFNDFFRPLEPSFGSGTTCAEDPICGVLGSTSGDNGGAFDPLRPLAKTISSSVDMSTTTALAPLAMSLGLPPGYIHARFMMARFKSAAENGTTLPSFENDVVPVFDRLRSSHDRAILAEWCGQYYTHSDEDKLKCLDISLQSAMILSSELEQRRLHNPGLAEEETQSLDNVKRITAAKESISDRLLVKDVLRRCALKTYGSATTLIANLIEALDALVAAGEDLSAESIVDFLLSTGSELAATNCLDQTTTLSTNQLRQLSSAVHAACNALSERHSHIHPDENASRLAHKWLFFGMDAAGDQNRQSTDESVLLPKIATATLHEVNEEDTINFVMDLDCIQGGNAWNDADAFVESQPLEDRRTSEEEPSALQPGAEREVSEYKSQVAALRIAFVLAYTGAGSDGLSLTSEMDEENTCPQGSGKHNSKGKKRIGLLTQMSSKRESRDDVSVLLSRELLRVVFAKAGDAASLGSFGMEGQRQAGTEGIKSVTFAMRHRALRAAAILCPQEALEQVISEEGFLRDYCSLKLCTFGSFVAKEIEEMGLPLPHSDLGQLSTMHYSSYARALWRHHSDGDMKGSKGRLLLLLLEMSMQESKPDATFIKKILTEMDRMELNRTILLAVERITSFKRRVGIDSFLLSTADVHATLENASKAIFSELKSAISSGEISKELAKDAVGTVGRLGNVWIDLATQGEQSELHRFVQVLQDLTSETKDNVLQKGLERVQNETMRRLSDLSCHSTTSSA